LGEDENLREGIHKLLEQEGYKVTDLDVQHTGQHYVSVKVGAWKKEYVQGEAKPEASDSSPR